MNTLCGIEREAPTGEKLSVFTGDSGLVMSHIRTMEPGASSVTRTWVPSRVGQHACGERIRVVGDRADRSRIADLGDVHDVERPFLDRTDEHATVARKNIVCIGVAPVGDRDRALGIYKRENPHSGHFVGTGHESQSRSPGR